FEQIFYATTELLRCAVPEDDYLSMKHLETWSIVETYLPHAEMLYTRSSDGVPPEAVNSVLDLFGKISGYVPEAGLASGTIAYRSPFIVITMRRANIFCARRSFRKQTKLQTCRQRLTTGLCHGCATTVVVCLRRSTNPMMLSKPSSKLPVFSREQRNSSHCS